MATRTPGYALCDSVTLYGQDNAVIAVCRQAKPRNTMVALRNAEHLSRCWNLIEDYCGGDLDKAQRILGLAKIAEDEKKAVTHG